MEDTELACFGSHEELVDNVRYYLEHDPERRRIAQAGFLRVVPDDQTCRNRMQQILNHAKLLL